MEYIAQVPDLSKYLFMPARTTAKMYEKSSGLDAAGKYLLHGVACLLVVPFCPIVGLINFIVAGILKLGSLCAKGEEDSQWYEKKIDVAVTAGFVGLVAAGFLILAIICPDLMVMKNPRHVSSSEGN